jgi:hypothetical protein
MELLGDWNWCLPRWLEWLPDISIEGRRPLAGEQLPDEMGGEHENEAPHTRKPQVEGVPVFGTPAHGGAPAH